MTKKWFRYALIGFVFGIFEWPFLKTSNILSEFMWEHNFGLYLIIPVVLGLNVGMWLVVVGVVALLEIRESHDLRLSTLAGVTAMVGAILSYYLLYTGLFAFWGMGNFEGLLLSNYGAPTFWSDWAATFNRILIPQFLKNMGRAIVGGTIGGFVAGWFFENRRKRKLSSSPA